MSSVPIGGYLKTMNNLESSLCATAVVVFILAGLLSAQRSSAPGSRFLQGYFALKALSFALWWLVIHPDSPYKAWWLGGFMLSAFWLAPCLWWYARYTSDGQLSQRCPLRLTDWGPAGLACLFVSPLLMAGHSGSLMMDPQVSPTTFLHAYIHPLMIATILLYLLQVPCYLWGIRRLINQHRQADFHFFSRSSDMPLYTLQVLAWLLMAGWGLALLRMLRALLVRGHSHWDPLLTCVDASLAVLAVYLISKRAIVQSAEAQPSEPNAPARYARSALNQPVRARISSKIAQALHNPQLIGRPDLKLQDLCNVIKERPQYVSQVISEDLQTSFYALINQKRIEAAKQRLLSDQHSRILDIALAVGFNSKTTFNNAFKQLTRMTPTAFRQQQQNKP